MNHEDVEAWRRAGLASGHAWAPCDECGEATLVTRGKEHPCRMTPRCPGTHRPEVTPTPLQALRSGQASVEDIRRWPPLDLGVTLRRLLDAKQPPQSP